MLLRAGSGRLTAEALEHQCQLVAQRMAMLYELNSPEFFDKSLFGQFVEMLRSHEVVTETGEGKLAFEQQLLEDVASDAQLVLHEQIRNSILQVVHR
jgi:glycerol-3-phosphate O-acyltransferase